MAEHINVSAKQQQPHRIERYGYTQLDTMSRAMWVSLLMQYLLHRGSRLIMVVSKTGDQPGCHLHGKELTWLYSYQLRTCFHSAK